MKFRSLLSKLRYTPARSPFVATGFVTTVPDDDGTSYLRRVRYYETRSEEPMRLPTRRSRVGLFFIRMGGEPKRERR
ncbi:MAG TPA: hypothetical protein VND64_24230, partial [Pirellulales bacterium]|nr:hypothetical protein [Pirellulales bacterium]